MTLLNSDETIHNLYIRVFEYAFSLAQKKLQQSINLLECVSTTVPRILKGSVQFLQFPAQAEVSSALRADLVLLNCISHQWFIVILC